MNCRRTMWALGLALAVAVPLAAPAAWAGGNPCAAKAQNPCAANPCAAKNPCAAQNPCAAANPCNPCAAKNPCAGGAVMKPAVARMVLGQVTYSSPQALGVRTQKGEVHLSADKLTQVRVGPTRRSLADLKAGDQVTVSAVERDGKARAAFVYVAAGGAANPCAANPCAAKQNPCAAKNPCAANPCAAKNPCAGKANPCAANPCAPKKQ